VAPANREYVGPYRLLYIVATSRTALIAEALLDAERRRVAIKMLRPEFTRDKEQIGLFKHEYAVGHAIEHERLVHIYELAVERDLVYMSMEFFPDRNLKQAIQQGAERIAHQAPKIIEQAAEGLAHFHSQGWIHRDIKPDNFLVNRHGEVKLIDFALAQRPKGGFARLIGGKAKVQGTRSYMAPEQIEGKHLSLQTDLYSFGCSLYELIRGKPPYTGISSNELLSKHLKAPIPLLSQGASNVTQEFAGLVKRMMAKNPADRPATMDDFLQEFRNIKLFVRSPQPPADEVDGKRGN
jgi:serine/threonine protein kinase